MVIQALDRANRLMNSTSLPLSDDGFSPQLARDIILAYQGALRALVEEIVAAQPPLAQQAEYPIDDWRGGDAEQDGQPNPAPASPPSQSMPAEHLVAHLFAHFGRQSVDVVEASYGLWAVVETTRRAVAILPDREHALHVASMFDVV